MARTARAPSAAAALQEQAEEQLRIEVAAGRDRRGPLEQWHVVGAAGEPAFGSPWANYPDLCPCRFRQDRAGFVWLQGQLTSNGEGGLISNNRIFTLPVNYRPTFTHDLPGNSLYNSVFSPLRCRIATDGAVSFPTVPANLRAAVVYLFGIHWRAQN